MDKILDILKLRYETVMNSITDQLFYDNVHSYVDWIEKTPKLKSIMDRISNDERKKHMEIWENKKNTPEDSEERTRKTIKLERFSTDSFYCDLYLRIYLVLEDYKTTSDSDYAQDPCALLMLRGIKNIPRKKWSKLMNKLPDRWSLSNLKYLNKWYSKKERKNYEAQLRQFHSAFLAEIERTRDIWDVVEQKIPNLHFDPRTGDFTYLKTKGTMAPGTQEFKLFSLLYSRIGIFVNYSEMYKAITGSSEEMRKSQKSIIFDALKNTKESLGILNNQPIANPDVFQNAKNIGYRLIANQPKINPK